MKKNKNTLKRILNLLHPYRFRMFVSLILAVVIVLTTLYLPILTGRAVDTIVSKGNVDFEKLIKVILLMIIMMCITAMAQWCMTAINNGVAYHMVRDIRNQAFAKIMKLPISYVDSTSHGEIINRVINDVDQFSEGLLMGFAQFFTGILTIILTIIILFKINVYVTLVVLLVTPIAMLVAGLIAKNTYKHFKSQSERRARMTGIVDEMIAGLGTVKNFNMENKIENEFKESDEALRVASQNAIFISAIAFPATRFVNSLVYAGVAISGALLAITGKMSVGQLTSVLSYATQYTKPFNEISGVVTELQNSFACAARVFALIDEEEILPDKDVNNKIENVDGNVEISHVYFSYDKSKKLIEDLNLDVKAGQRIAIVGPTGSGKSTIINLLMRFYDIDSGSIKIEGKNINDITRKSIRENFGMVLQETWLKNASIRDNIAFGKPDATFEEIEAAAKEAYADSFIKRLPDGYDTIVTEGGENLSAGQRQLLCIARIMLVLPPMLILDEATSSIDTMTEARISKAFDKMMTGRTSFVVAHRLSTIKNADVILVLKDGHIIEQGNHNELMEMKGFYYELNNAV
ncbi:ABC transporter ATP-binding protein [Lachnoanaerobaculum sp. JCM 36186]|uniref:ABC transporter ATP-binding protein n=1 Tax=Lachnoanaerobaculum sanguinis TaxID=3065809 RepID=UPI002749B020|nr:ABC transporter ATP-binding protein [Lachnoanaerobaculum sp. JCM 36186]GMO01879.1 ABC transporter ATP-binding protein [Lachnoanaerobaculum sp. JCM 36186]